MAGHSPDAGINLSIAPSLELKRKNFLEQALALGAINRTIFGIETGKRYTELCQAGTINRTIFGIETHVLEIIAVEHPSINRTIFVIETSI